MRYYLIILLLTTSTQLLWAQARLDSIREVFSERIQKTMKKQKIVGASISVVSRDSILWQYNFGYSDKAAELSVASNTLFGLGSVTKVFTATCVMQLKDAEKVFLDNSLSNYLPEFKIKGPSANLVTPRNLMTHHSGLPSDIFKGMFTRKPEDYKVMVDYLKDEYMAGTPNQIRAYSNPGYTLLGHMIYNVSNMGYGEYVQRHILNPLNMNHSGLNKLSSASKTYDSKGEFVADVLLRDTPAGGLFSTADDMSKFISAYLNQSPAIMKASSFEEVMNSQHDNSPLDFENDYGLGWSISQLPHAGKLLTHTGTTLYFNAALKIAPEADLGVIILTNSEKGGWLFREAENIIEAVAAELDMPKQSIDFDDDLGSTEVIDLKKNELEPFTGIYTAPGAHIKTYLKGKKLNMKLQGLRVVMLPVSSNVFLPKIMLFGFIPIKMKKARFIFENIDGEEVLTLKEKGSPKELTATKLSSQPVNDVWRDRLGTYEIVNALEGELNFFKDFQLKEENGILILSFEQVNNGQKLSMALEIINDERARIGGLGRYAGQSLQIKQDHIKIFGFDLKKISND